MEQEGIRSEIQSCLQEMLIHNNTIWDPCEHSPLRIADGYSNRTSRFESAKLKRKGGQI